MNSSSSQKKKITYKQLFAFIKHSEKFLEKNSGTKLAECVKAVRRYILKNELVDGYQDLIQALQLKHASVDAGGNVIMDANGLYSYVPDAIKKLAEETKATLKNHVEVIVRILPENDKVTTLTDQESIAFEGIVISELID